MARWRYRTTIHGKEEILAVLSEPVDSIPSTVFCDVEGDCFFDDGPNPLTHAIETLLNRIGSDGWELVQVVFRTEQIIAFWKRPA